MSLPKGLQYKVTNERYTFSLFNNNQKAQNLSANPVFLKKTKHIDVQYHFTRECPLNK